MVVAAKLGLYIKFFMLPNPKKYYLWLWICELMISLEQRINSYAPKLTLSYFVTYCFNFNFFILKKKALMCMESWSMGWRCYLSSIGSCPKVVCHKELLFEKAYILVFLHILGAPIAIITYLTSPVSLDTYY